MEEFKKALSEVNIIINNIPKGLQEKILKSFRNTIEEERDKQYNPDINKLLLENNMLPETIIILGMIYRDFLCSESERENLKKKEREKLKENKYSYENLFKNKETYSEDSMENKELALVEIKEKDKWYERVLKFFKSILKI